MRVKSLVSRGLLSQDVRSCFKRRPFVQPACSCILYDCSLPKFYPRHSFVLCGLRKGFPSSNIHPDVQSACSGCKRRVSSFYENQTRAQGDVLKNLKRWIWNRQGVLFRSTLDKFPFSSIDPLRQETCVILHYRSLPEVDSPKTKAFA